MKAPPWHEDIIDIYNNLVLSEGEAVLHPQANLNGLKFQYNILGN